MWGEWSIVLEHKEALECSDRELLEHIYHLLRSIDRKAQRIMSATDPLSGEITTLTTDVATLQTQNSNLISLVQKLASAAGVNTAADLAALQAVDSSVTGITAADVAAIAAGTPASPPASTPPAAS